MYCGITEETEAWSGELPYAWFHINKNTADYRSIWVYLLRVVEGQ